MAILRLATKPKSAAPPLLEKQAFSGDQAQASPAELSASVGRNRRILVVDDNQVILKAFQLKLERSGFQVTTSTEEAAVASTAEQAKAELIILDVNFPSGSGSNGMEWNGFTILQWLERFPELANIPVILITGEDVSKLREKALGAGVAAIFQKPIIYKEFLPVLLEALGDSAV
jgi:two-component system cell cycle response regulator DivK